MDHHTALDRLNEILDQRDNELSAARERIKELEQMLHGAENGWSAHRETAKEQSLPVPRLEMEISRTGEMSMEWEYRLIMRHLLGHCVIVPLGHTRSTGSLQSWPPRDKAEDGSAKLRLPFRDGAHFNHDAQAFGCPAFVLCDGEIEPHAPWAVPHLQVAALSARSPATSTPQEPDAP